jgi:predicted metalloprotease with PDZ domain
MPSFPARPHVSLALLAGAGLAAAALPATPAALLGQDAGASPVRYDIRFPNAAHHEAELTVTFSGLGQAPLELQMSRSSPGRYALHEFAKNVYGLTAAGPGGRGLSVERATPSRWRVAEHAGTVVVHYTLFGDHADGTYPGIDRTHAHLNMPAVFLYARGLEDRPIEVTFHLPEGSGWKVGTQLVPTSDPERFTAPDLQYFMDSPTELSAFDERSWREASRDTAYTIRLFVHHQGTAAELDRYEAMVKRIVREEKAVFGELPPYDYGTYTFLAGYLPWVYGDGMEHRNSTFLTSTRPLSDSADAVRDLSALAHEFFHAWNMERIRDRAIEPFDFSRADMSGLLWFGEGFTQYFGQITMERAGFTGRQSYLDQQARTLDYVLHSPGRRVRGPVGMSQASPFVDAASWIDRTNTPNTFISYYSYGAVLALGLDLTLRTRYDLTLDDYMRAMWTRFGRTGTPYTLADLRTTLADVTGDAEFARRFFEEDILGSGVPDFGALLGRAGLLLRPAHPEGATLGRATLEAVRGGVRVSSPTLVGSPLYAAGIDLGDVVHEFDGRKITNIRDITTILGAHAPGDSVTLAYGSRDGEHRARVALAANDALQIVPFEKVGRPVTDAMRRLREAWLGSETGGGPQGAGAPARGRGGP